MDNWIALLGAGGGGAALLAFINGFWQWRNGTHEREATKNMNLIAQRDSALLREDEAHVEAREARREAAHNHKGVNLYREHAAQTRVIAIECGVKPDDLPEWPKWRPFDELTNEEKPNLG